MAKKLRYSGEIPRIPIDADTSAADQKIDGIFNRLNDLQHVKIDVDVSMAQRRLETMVKRTNKQMSSDLVNTMLKDFKLVAGAAKTEFESLGKTDIFKGLEKTCNMVEDRFANLTISIDKKQISGLENILNATKEIKAISDFSFGEVASKAVAKDTQATLSNVRAIKKEIGSIANKIDYIQKKINNSGESVLSADKLSLYEKKLQGLSNSLKGFYAIEDEIVQNALVNATSKINKAIGDIQIRMPKVQISSDTSADKATFKNLATEEKKAKAIQEVASRISTHSSIKGLKNLHQEAVDVTKVLGEMYDEGIRDTERYITLQYKLQKIFDKLGKGYGGVKHSGAKNSAELLDFVIDGIQQQTGTNLFSSSGYAGVMEDLFGDSDFSLFNKSLKGLGMKHVAELLLVTGKTGDWVDLQKQVTIATENTVEAQHVVENTQDGIISAKKEELDLVKQIGKEEVEAIKEATKAKSKYYEIDEKAAKISKQMRSFDDYKEGSATASYRVAIDEIAAIVEEKKHQFPDKSEQLDQLLDRYAKNLAAYINRDNQIGAQYPSVMISGAGNYNIKKHNRQMASWGKNYQFYDEKVAALENKIRNLGSVGTEVIRGDEEGALERLEAKLEYMKYWHEIMVEVNKYYKKNKTLDGFDGVEPDELDRIKKDLAVIKQVGMYDTPYPSYALTNDSQNIKRIEGRIAELKRLKDSDGLQEVNDIYKLWTDKKDMRIRISFEMGKPDQEVIDILKGKAFKWSRKNDAWQRQLTSNAIYDTKQIQKSLHEFYKIEDQSNAATAAIEAQTKATEKLAEARLKLTPKKDGSGEYTAMDGKYEIGQDAEGWKVFQRDNAGLWNLIGTYKHFEDIKNDVSLLTREEIIRTDEVIQQIKTLQEAYQSLRTEMGGYMPLANKYIEVLDSVKSGAMSASDAISKLNEVIASRGLPGVQTKPQSGTLEHLVDSLEKLDSISADPLNKIVESIAIGKAKISSEVQEILKSISLLNESGEFSGKYITEGMNNNGVITNGKYAIIARTQEHYDEPESYEYDFKAGTTYIDNLIAKEKEAAEQGVNLARVLHRIKSEATNGKDLFYEIQEFVPGKQLHAFDESKKNIQDFEQECARLVGASSVHIQKLMSDIIKLNKLGFFIDFSPANILYDTEKGFSLIDLSLRDLGLEAQTTTELMEGLFDCLMDFADSKERMKLGTEDAMKWSSSMMSVHNKLAAVFGQNDFGADIGSVTSKFSGEFAKYIKQAEQEHLKSIKSMPQLVDNYGKSLDEVNNKLMQGTKLLNEQGQILRLFHNSAEIFDKFDVAKAGSNQGQALGTGNYLALAQNGEFNDLAYGRYQTQWYANVQNAFNVADKLTSNQAASVIDKFLEDRAEGFKQHMLSKLLDGDVTEAIKDIAHESKTTVGEIFGHLGYDAIMDGAQINVFDPSKIHRANNSVLDIGTGEFDAFRELQKKIWEEQKIIQKANDQIKQLTNQYSGRTKEQLNMDLFGETLLRAWNWRDNVAKIASEFKALTGELPKVDGISEESMRAMVENYEFARQNIQGYQDTVAKHEKILNQLTSQFFGQEAKINASTKSYLTGNVDGVVNKETIDQVAVENKVLATESNITSVIEESVKEKQALVEQTEAHLAEEKQVTSELQIQKARLDEIYNIAKQNRGRDLIKDRPNNLDGLRQKVDELKTLIPQLKELQAEVTQMDVDAHGPNFNTSFLAASYLAEAITNKTRDLNGYSAALDALTKVEEFSAKASETYGISKKSKKFDAGVMDKYKELIIGLQNGLSVDGAMSQLGEVIQGNKDVVESKQAQAQAAENATKQIEAQANAEEKLAAATKKTAQEKIQQTQAASDVSVEELVSREISSALNQLRSAKDNETTLFSLKGVFDGEELVNQAHGMIENIAKQANLSLGKFSVKDNIIKAQLYNEELKIAVDQTYQLVAATEEMESSQLQLVSQSFSQNIKALNENNFDVEGMQARALAAIEKTRSSLHGLAYDLTELENIAKNISSQDDFTKFSNQLKAEQDNIQAIRNSTVSKSSMNPLANMQRDMKNANIEIETMRLKLEKFGDVKGVSDARQMLEEMTAAAKEYNAATDAQGQQTAYNRFSDVRSSFKAQTDYIKAAQDLNKSQAASDKQVNPIREQYQSILDLVNKINAASNQITSLKKDDGGTGILSGKIEQVKAEKERLIAEIQSITKEINTTLSSGFVEGNSFSIPDVSFLGTEGSGAISSFLSDVRTQASLTTAEIEALIQAFQKSESIDIKSSSKFIDKFKSVEATAKKLRSETSLDHSNESVQALEAMYAKIMQYRERILSGDQTLKPADAFELNTLIEQFTKYGDILAETSAKEAKYFAGKQKYTQGTTYGSAIEGASEELQKLNDIRSKLEKAARSYAKDSGANGSFITNFAQGADGISRLDFSVFDTGTNSLRNFRMEMGSVTQGMYVTETTVNKSLANIQAAQKQLQSVGDLLGRLDASGVNIKADGSAAVQIQTLLERYRALTTELSKGDGASQNRITKLTKDLQIASAEVEKLYKAMMKTEGDIIGGAVQDLGRGDAKGDVYGQLINATHQLKGAQQAASIEVGRFDAANNSLNASLVSANGTVQHYTLSMNGLSGQMTAQQAGVSKLANNWDIFSSTLKQSISRYTSMFTGFYAFYRIIAVIREGINTVKELDTAMTELKKVTDATEATYASFLNTMSGYAREVGTTVTDITTSAADWARLGYSLEEAGNLAKNTSILMNVSEFENVSDATDSLISALQAYKDEGSDVSALSMQIIDAYNTVGNRFAISTSDLASSLTRSSAALVAANNDLAESIALTTAANTTIQNPESVGNALKVVSMRIRGVKSELEEAGEDTEGMVVNTAKLQEKIRALTSVDGNGGINILANTGEFKSTYQILLEISKVWDKLSDTSQASLLETLAGKTRGSVVAALLQNGDILEESYEAALNSSGSSAHELETYLDSIAGKSEQLSSNMQVMWSNTINSSVIKYFLDLGLMITDLVKQFGLLPPILAGVLTYFAAFKNITPASLFKGLTENINLYSAAIKQVQAIQPVTMANSGMLNAQSVNAYAAAVANLSGKQQAAILTTNGLSNAQAAQVLAHNGVNDAIIRQTLGQNALNIATQQSTVYTEQEIIAKAEKVGVTLSESTAALLAKASQEGLTAAKVQEIMVSKGCTQEEINLMLSMLGLKTATDLTSFSFKALGTAMKTAFKSNPLGWIMMIVSAVTMLKPLIDDIFKSVDEKIQEAEEKLTELQDKVEQTASNFRSLKSSADEVIPRFAELAKGVDQFGKNVSLTDEEYKEFLSLNNQIASMFPEINMGMDSNGNAMLALSTTANTLEQSLWDLVEAERVAANKEIADTMPDVFDNIVAQTDAYQKKLSSVQNDITEFEKLYSSFTGDDQVFTNVNSKDDVDDINRLIELYEQLGIQVTKTSEAGNSRSATITLSFDYDQEEVTRNYENIMAGLEKGLEDAKERISNSWKQLNPVLTAWAETDYTYQGLSDDMKKVAQAMMTGLDFSQFTSAEDVQNHIKNNILNVISSMSSDAQAAFSKLLSLDANSLSTQDYIDKIRQLAKEIEDMDIGWTADDILDKMGLNTIIKDCEDTKNKIVAILGEGWEDSASYMEELMGNVAKLTPTQLMKAFDIIKDYGIKTWDELQAALNDKTFDMVVDYDDETSGMEQLLTAMEESLSATGLSAESIANLKARYQDLEGYDPARLFEETTHGIHLNAQALRELESAYRKHNKEALDNKLDSLIEQYNDLTEQISECSDVSKRAELYTQRQNVLDQINDTATLTAQYAGLTSAYKKWQDIQSAGNERDPYESIISGKEELDEELSRGWLDEGSRAYLELLSGQDLSTANYEKLLSVYKELGKNIGNSGYSVYDFFTQDSDGNSTTEGIFNFFDAVKAKQKELGEEWVTIDEDGNYSIDFGVNGDKAVADALGISEELVQILLKAAQDAGFEVNLDTAYSQLADFKDEAKLVNDTLKALGATEYTFNFNSTDIDDLNTQIDEAKKALANLKNEDGTLKVGVDEKTYQDAQTMLATLIYQKQTLDKSDILKVNIDMDSANEGIETVIAKLLDFKTKYNNLEVTAAVGADTTEAQKEVDAAIAALNAEDKEILASLGIDTTKTSAEINAAINSITTTLMVDCGLNTELVEDYQASEHTTTGTVIWDNNISAVTAWINQTHNADGTVKWGNDTTKVKTVFTAKGKIEWSGGDNVNGTAHKSGTAHANGTAFAGGSWGAPKTEIALMGELGPELIVRGNRWFTVGDQGATFEQVKQGDIIFNHKQTEELLEHGYVTSRGKAYASGTAYSSAKGPGRYTVSSSSIKSGSSSSKYSPSNKSNNLDKTTKSASDSAEEFAETFDWIEVRLEEINEQLDLMDAKLQNAANYASKNNIIDSMMDMNKTKMTNLTAGIKKYSEYAAKLLKDVPAKYREAAQDGAISITEFAGEADEKTVEAIEKYREWAQKVAELQQELEETKTTLQDLAVQKMDNARETGDVRAAIDTSQNEKLQNAVDYDEEKGLIAAPNYYATMIANSAQTIGKLTTAREEMQKAFDQAVQDGTLVKYSDAWYEALNELYQIDAEIDEAVIDMEKFQNAINDIYWENFDNLINQFDYITDDAQGLIDLMDELDMVTEPKGKTYDGGTVKFWTADDVKWTKEGLATMGLHAQKLEVAEEKSKQYAKAIDDLTKDYKAGRYSEIEYQEKLAELTNGQYEAIEAAQDEKEAIVELHEARVESIKEGIEKEVEAYEELIEKQKEQLDSEKDLYDFQKNTADQQKNIADIERQLAALAYDTSLSATAKRKQLEAELAEAQYELQDTYYNRSIEDKQNALDVELEAFQAEKDAEIAKWEEYLDNVEQVVADSLNIVQENAIGIGQTLTDKTNEFNLTVSDAILSPWKDGASAIDDYTTKFGDSASSTIDQLKTVETEWQNIRKEMNEANKLAAAYANYAKQYHSLETPTISEIKEENSKYTAATKKTTPSSTTTTKPPSTTTTTTTTPTKTIKVGGKINAGSAKIYSYAGDKNGSRQYFKNDPIYTVLAEKSGYLKVRHHKLSSGVTGWFKKSDVKAYAKGSLGVNKDQLALIDELGEELVLHAGPNGKLQYLTKGTGVVPADITANLMKLGELNPQEMLDRNRPQIAPNKNIVNTEINLDCSVGELIHIEHCDQNTLPDVEKLVNKAFEKQVKNLNNSLRRFTR